MQATQQNIWFALITLVFTGLYQWAAPLPAWVDIAFLSSCLLFTGIPHGAIDHVIFAQRHQAQPFSLIRQFFLPYLLLIAATALCWILVPNLMFWVFLGIAAYHFGQSQLYYLPPGKAGFPRGLLYMLWGVFLLSWLWTSHWESQIANLQSLFTWDLAINQPLHQTIIVLRWISVSLVALVIAVLCMQRKISVAAAITELIVLAILVYMVRNLPLYTAFALYFGLWHATRVMCTEYSYLRNARQAPFTVRQFLQQFIPFSVLSIIGLIILVIAGSFWDIRVSPFMLFLIFISALTTPHVWVMEHMYGHLSKPAPSNS
jgi:Brp/Blh family beta-carotene 15,15'-monooxygenase